MILRKCFIFESCVYMCLLFYITTLCQNCEAADNALHNDSYYDDYEDELFDDEELDDEDLDSDDFDIDQWTNNEPDPFDPTYNNLTSTDDNEPEVESYAKSHRRRNSHKRPSSKGAHRGRGNKRRRNRIKKDQVTLPSGAKIHLARPPMKTGRKCKTKLISIRRRGKTARKYKMIANELEKTKFDIDDCEHRGGCVKHFKIAKIQRIINGCIWKRYFDRKTDIAIDLKGNPNERMLFHGSSKVWNIIGNGFDERHANIDGVYGAGVYFADKSSASNEYAFGILGGKGCPKHKDKACKICIRKMILARVALGKQQDEGDKGNQHPHSPVGTHSVVGKNGASSYKEYIVYRGEQAYPEYLISYRITT